VWYSFYETLPAYVLLILKGKLLYTGQRTGTSACIKKNQMIPCSLYWPLCDVFRD